MSRPIEMIDLRWIDDHKNYITTKGTKKMLLSAFLQTFIIRPKMTYVGVVFFTI